MKVATRVGIGFALLAGTMGMALACALVAIHRIEAVMSGLSNSSFGAAQASLQLIRASDLVAEYTRRFATGGNARDLASLRESQEDFENSLGGIHELARTPQEEKEIRRLGQFWKEYMAETAQWQQPTPAAPKTLSESVQDQLDRLRSQSASVHEASRTAIDTSLQQASQAVSRAVRLCWSAVALALALSGFGALIVLRSISVPLHNLVEGARALADGKSFYRLDTSRRDELSELAREINRLSERANQGT